MTDTPTVSVLVTTYNHAPFVRECLESLAAQTTRDFEAIITDDASTDGTGDLIEAWLAERRFPARFIRNPTNRGLCANRNAALALARGRFICSLAGDDAYEPTRIAQQAAFLDRAPAHVAMVYSDMHQVDAAGRRLALSFFDYHFAGNAPPEGDVFQRMLRGAFIPSPATMVRRSAIDAVGLYDETLFYEDYDMWLRMCRRFHAACLPEPLVRYRVLPSSMSHSFHTRRAMLESTARVLESWRGRTLPEAECDRLRHLARIELLLGRDRAARQKLIQAARHSGLLRLRLRAHLLGLPGICHIARLIAKLRHGLRQTSIAYLWPRIAPR